MSYYRGTHRTQFDGGPYQNQNCTPTSGANGARCATGGAKDESGSDVRSLVQRKEEQNPNTPGWSLDDLDLAMTRLGVGFEIQSRVSWADALDYSDRGYGLALQGLSAVFTEGCSATFDGGHCLYLHPDHKWPDLRLIGDPLCREWRYERAVRLQQYVERLHGKDHIRFGVFTRRVPLLTPETDTEDPVDPKTTMPVAVCDVASGGTVYEDEGRTTQLIKSWAGGKGVQLYGKPVKPAPVNGKSPLVPVRLDLAGGPSQNLVIGWVGWDKVSNVRLP